MTTTTPARSAQARSAQGRSVQGLRVEAARVRAVGDRLGQALWAVAGLALVFTMANVTVFAVAHGTPWQIAWLLDPMASLALLVVLVGDGVLARHGVPSDGWARVVKVGAGTATWSMNVWASVAARDVAGVVLHSVAPALVIALAEATPTYRAKFAALADHLDAQADALDQLDQADVVDQPAPAAAAPAEPAAPAEVAPPARTLSRTHVEGPATRTLTRTHVESPARTLARTEAGSGGRTVAGPEGRTERRSEVELGELVRAAIRSGTLPAAPSGTAIQRAFGGGKSPAVRLAAQLAARADQRGQGDPAGRGGGQLLQLRYEGAGEQLVAS